MNGFINLKKERGMTSFKCVAAVRKILGEKKTGHGGTLDPEAWGVLPVCLGQGTKCSEYFLRMKKSYRGEITFGYATDTMDIWGNEIKRFEGSLDFVTEEKVREALCSFSGEIEQVPSMYSAIKKDGVPLYKLARKGIETEVAARKVNIYDIALESFTAAKDSEDGLPKAVINMTCSKGTYVRSVCNDLGESLGCFGVMSALCRTAYGNMTVEEGVTLEELSEAVSSGNVEKYILPLDWVLQDFPKLDLSKKETLRYTQGKTVLAEQSAFGERTVSEGDEIALYYMGKVFAVATAEPFEEKILLKTNKFFGVDI